MSTEVYTFDTKDMPSSDGIGTDDEPDNIIFHVDLPWLTVLTKTYALGDKIVIHADIENCDAADVKAALSLVPAYSLRLPERHDIRTLGVEREVTLSYWLPF